MKAVVVEIRGSFVSVLSDDGRIIKAKNQNYEVGQVIEMRENSTKKHKFIPAVSVAAAVLIIGSVSAYAYYSPYSYVSLDVNPSIEYTLNRFNRVLKVSGVNDDGEKIVEELQFKNLNNKKIEDAISETVKQIEKEGYFEGDLEPGIVLAVSTKDEEKTDALAEDLKESAENAAEDENVTVESYPVGLERVQEAQELGVTPGKLNLVEKLRDGSENPDDVDLEEWLNKPVKEIMQEIKNNKKEYRIEERTATRAGQEDSSSKISDISGSDAESSDSSDIEETEAEAESEVNSKAGKSENKQEDKQTGNSASKQEDKQTGNTTSKQEDKQTGNSASKSVGVQTKNEKSESMTEENQEKIKSEEQNQQKENQSNNGKSNKS